MSSTRDLALLAAGAALSARSETVTEYRTIHEHRAPTDESVRLLREMEDAARRKAEASISIENNGFNCVVHSWHDGFEDRIRARAIFDINGTRMAAEVSAPDGAEKHALITQLRDAIAKEIANTALDTLVEAVCKR